MNLDQDTVDKITRIIDETHYALSKQIDGSSPDNRYGSINIYKNEREEYENFLTDLLERRIVNLTELKEDIEESIK